MEDNLQVTEGKREVIQSFLITTARYKFSIYEKRILSKIITALQPLVEGKHLYGRLERGLFDTSFCELSSVYLRGEDKSNGKLYQEALKGLATKGIEYQKENGDWEFCNLIAFPKIKNGKVSFTISNDMVDLFLNFSKGYSKYILSVSLSLKSTASARLYELISNQPQPIKYNIDTLKQMLGVADTYPLTGNFIQRVILPAKRELDEVANWSFDFRPIRGASGKYVALQLIPINYKEREPQEVQRAEAIRRTHLSWFIQDDVKRKLLDLGFTPRNLKNMEDYINKFIQICGDNSVEKITEIWIRGNGLHEPKKYLMGTIKRIVKEFEN